MVTIPPPATWLPAWVQTSIIGDSIEEFADAAWFAWREPRPARPDIRNGVWWTADGARVLSVAITTDHPGDITIWDTFPLEGAAEGSTGDECRHGSMAEAEACAREFLRTGRQCMDSD